MDIKRIEQIGLRLYLVLDLDLRPIQCAVSARDVLDMPFDDRASCFDKVVMDPPLGDDQPGDSQRNAERNGFRIAYTRMKWRLSS